MAALTRIYVIARRDGTGLPRMVEASNASAAMRHVTEDTFQIDTPTPIEAVRLAQIGVTLEQVKVDLTDQTELPTT